MEIWGDISLVYWPEHSIQAGAWTAFALPPSDLHDGAARQRAYELLNLCYQVGVFFSRSSGNLIVLRRPALWAIAWLQVANPSPNPNPSPSPSPSPNPNPNPSPNPNPNPNPSPNPKPSPSPNPNPSPSPNPNSNPEQVANLVFFVADGALHFWTGASLSLPALLVGCCAGTLYVHTFTA